MYCSRTPSDQFIIHVQQKTRHGSGPLVQIWSKLLITDAYDHGTWKLRHELSEAGKKAPPARDFFGKVSSCSDSPHASWFRLINHRGSCTSTTLVQPVLPPLLVHLKELNSLPSFPGEWLTANILSPQEIVFHCALIPLPKFSAVSYVGNITQDALDALAEDHL